MLRTFTKGGIHPPEYKITAGQQIRFIDPPKEIYVPVSQHIGVPAEILVEKRQKVKKAEVIARAKGPVSANIHAPLSGTVTKLNKIVDSSGYKTQCIVIKTDLKDKDNYPPFVYPLKTEINLESDSIVNRIGDYGIVGLGGAAFPTHVKLSTKDKKIEHLIINGVECEPYLTADHALMLEKADEIIVGIRILLNALKINKAYIGIENNKKDAIKLFKEKLKGDSQIKVAALQVKYPQGSEKQLIKALLDCEVPKNGLPMDVGVVVQNVGTVYAIYLAVQHDKPLIQRVVTVTGLNLKNPGNYWVKIGTPIKYLIEVAGGLPEDTGKVLVGGPMMGKAIKNLDVPITKGTSGIVVMPEKESHKLQEEHCIRCGECVSVCPMGLEPYLLMDLTKKHMFEEVCNEDIMHCIECGSCSYVCPSHRPLIEYIRYGKKIIKQRKK